MAACFLCCKLGYAYLRKGGKPRVGRRVNTKRTPIARGARATGRGAHERELRIIAGEWRGRRFRFPADATIRPTPDRVRETLFNWLAAHVPGARVLDLFAGSGALGLEALSRGAREARFVERDRQGAAGLRAVLQQFGATNAYVAEMDARRYLAGPAEAFDLVFLDPPFDSDVLPDIASVIETAGWLAPTARIYVEAAASASLEGLPATWEKIRSGRAGEVGYHLFARSTTGAAQE